MKYTKKRFLKHLKEIAIISLAGVLFNVLFFKVTPVNTLITVLIWLTLSKGNGYVVDFIDKRISWVEQPILRVFVGISSMLLFTISAFAIIIIGIRWVFEGRDPLKVLRLIEFGDFTEAILITLIITMFLHGRAFYLNWKQALYREEKLKNETLKSQYESLKNQVNPHFLFNSLNVLSSLVYDDQKKAVEFIRKMSNVYRYVLDKRNQELVSLEDEMAFVKSYYYLQKIRFDKNLELIIDQKGDGMVPPLAIQLLVENAIKHNVVSEAYPLHVKIAIDSETVTVENTIKEKQTKDSTGIGLENLKARYSFLTDKTLNISGHDGIFRVSLPLLTMEK